MNTRSVLAPTTSASSTSTSGSASASRASMSAWIALKFSLRNERKWACAHFRTAFRPRWPVIESCGLRIAPDGGHGGRRYAAAMAVSEADAAAVIDTYLHSLEGETRQGPA